MEEQVSGALSGSHASTETVPVSALSGFDPARVKEADSENYGGEFFGILNKQGQFWTVLAFDTPEKATAHVERFWPNNTAAWRRSNFKVVPVRIRLTAIAMEAGTDKTPKGV